MTWAFLTLSYVLISFDYMSYTLTMRENLKQLLKLFFDLRIVLLLILFFLLGVMMGRFIWVSDFKERDLAVEASPSPITSLAEVREKEQGEIEKILPVTYVVQVGDSTWQIAEAFYGDGQKYVDIEKANGLTADALLEVGQELTIPKLEVDQPASDEELSQLEIKEEIETEAAYVVQANDSLWFIALKYLNDGTRWVEIYNQNRPVIGENPNLIYPGQTFILPAE